ncbi:MAG: helix-turn-helix transcriptional regulator [Thermodesulfobacteriota bacterium]|nr:helix-turn-helix transcriptional regulator [Thermodesulfobacteriota bacterium]
MNIKSIVVRQEFDLFSSGILHGNYPQIDLFQLGAGAIQGWLISARIGSYRVSIGSFNRTLLYEGHYNPEMLHIGFLLHTGNSAMVLGHNYDADNFSMDLGYIPVHGVLQANSVWANIYAPERVIMTGVQYSRKKMKLSPHLMIGNSRKKLIPITQFLNKLMSSPNGSWNINETDMASRLQYALHNLLATSFKTEIYGQPFAKGDMFQMSLLKKLHELSRMYRTQPLSLGEICNDVGMKQRTLQKYFHELYGMGPTEYFRLRRLNGAHTDLLKGTPKVSDVAAHWKFTHLGRFSGSYKTLFGESPKTTRERMWLFGL